MKAVLTDDRFDDDGWLYERKLDGIRLLAFRHGDDVRLLTRNRKRRNSTFPELVDALLAQPADDLVLDLEVVAFDGGVTSFSRLQGRSQLQDERKARNSGIAVFGYVFDLLHLDGHDLRDVPLRDRKRVLKAALDWEDPLRLTPHRTGDGVAFWREACEKGWEGVIAKDGASRYRGSRSRDWLKFKCVAEQELVVVGFTDPDGSRVGFGALLVGYWQEGDDGRGLRYAGSVGTGYDDHTLRELRDRLDDLEVDDSPLADGQDGLPAAARTHWVQPSLVAQVGFSEWTHHDRLRHPRFLGLRDDKDPDDVVRERPRTTNWQDPHHGRSRRVPTHA
jgi:DNA ligase D-like protein (predicted ligase)